MSLQVFHQWPERGYENLDPANLEQVLPNEMLQLEGPVFDSAKQLKRWLCKSSLADRVTHGNVPSFSFFFPFSHLSLDMILQLRATAILSKQRHAWRRDWARDGMKIYNRLSLKKEIQYGETFFFFLWPYCIPVESSRRKWHFWTRSWKDITLIPII